MNEPEDRTPKDIWPLSDSPELFVVDDSLTVLFSSAAQSEQLDGGFADVLRDAVKRHRQDGARFGIFEDRIVRVEPLVGSDGSRSYAVLLQRFSAVDMLAAARTRFSLSDLEARLFDVLLRGDDPESALADQTTANDIAAGLSGLRQKTDGLPIQALLERLLGSG